MPPHDVAVLLHLAGFLTGAALYALLLSLVLKRRVSSVDVSDDRLPLVTAILGLVWNFTALAAYGMRDFAAADPHPMLIATAFSALGFLPAVAVHSVLRSNSGERTRPAAAAFICIAYAVSTIAEALTFWSARHGVAPSPAALRTLTWSYAALTIPVFLLTRRRADAARGWSLIALAVFAVSALHLSHGEGPHESWFTEVIGHHASIALIFAILYQDFRFALADVFLKRALALFALAGVVFGLYAGVEVPLLANHDFRTDPVAIGGSVVLWAAVALFYQSLRRGSGWIVDRLVLHRVDYGRLREQVARDVDALDDVDAVLNHVCSDLRVPLAAESVTWREGDGATVNVLTTEHPHYTLSVGRLAGGRRLLSDDVELLRAVAVAAARRIDAIRLSRERYVQGLREQEISKLATEAELRALRAQVNPHFLFNALNTIGYLIQTSPALAHATLMKLTSLLRGVLFSGGATTTLGHELDLITAYLDIERARFEERLRVNIDVDESLRTMRIPPLTVQPLVENAIKHGVARSRSGGEVDIVGRLEGDALVIRVRNTGAAASEIEIAHGRRRGVGLANLEARLAHYHRDARFTLVATTSETVATVVLPAAIPAGMAKGA
jgi:two-component system LytT family sensor kinase